MGEEDTSDPESNPYSIPFCILSIFSSVPSAVAVTSTPSFSSESLALGCGFVTVKIHIKTITMVLYFKASLCLEIQKVKKTLKVVIECDFIPHQHFDRNFQFHKEFPFKFNSPPHHPDFNTSGKESF